MNLLYSTTPWRHRRREADWRYRSQELAEAAIGRLNDQPGFRDDPTGVGIDQYPLDEDHRTQEFLSGPS